MVSEPPFSTVISAARVTPESPPAVELRTTPGLVATVPPEMIPLLPS